MSIASPKQQLVFDEVKNTKNNIAVQATAGSGKTYTLLGLLKLIPKFKKTIFLAFSNAIVNELKDRVPNHVKASTLHSLGYKFINSRFKGLNLNENKYFNIALKEFPKKDRNKEVYKKCYTIQEICNYARLTLTDFNEESIKELCENYCIDASPECILIANIILEDNASTLKHLTEIDFTDMIYIPAKFNELVIDYYDYILVDESQDLNKAQMALLEAITRKPGGRVIAVGDNFQSIYGFTGSSVDSFLQVQSKFNMKQLPLTVTYRCAKKIVELAQTVYPDVIEAHPDAIEGIVAKGLIEDAMPGDMIICRNTRPLIEAFFELIGKDRKAYVEGKGYVNGLINLAESVASYSKEAIQQNINDKLQGMISEMKADGIYNAEGTQKYISLLEKCQILEVILNKIDRADQLVSKIQEIFHEDKEAIRLMSIHRCKGLECDRVFFIEKFNNEKLLPSKYAVLDWQKTQEQNLLFVAYTRAKKEFYFVDYQN